MHMTNLQIHRKTLPFAFVMFLIDLVGLAAIAGCAVAGYFIANSLYDRALIGLGVGFLAGIIPAVLISVFITNRFKAGQIAIMTHAVADDKIPEHVVKEGLGEVKGRFAKITAFFFVTSAIKGIFRQIGRGIDRLAGAIGGQAGNAVSSAINSGVQILLSYLCDCCLGWVMYRKDEGTAKAACEGAVIFFKSGKTLIRNVGRIFGMGFASLLLIGGALFGILYLIFRQFPAMLASLSAEIIEVGTRYNVDLPAFISDTNILTLIIAGIIAIALWSTIHAVLIRPFILIGVLRNFMAAGKKRLPTEADFNELASKSPRFAKLQRKA